MAHRNHDNFDFLWRYGEPGEFISTPANQEYLAASQDFTPPRSFSCREGARRIREMSASNFS
jgi:hypothetical protein